MAAERIGQVFTRVTLSGAAQTIDFKGTYGFNPRSVAIKAKDSNGAEVLVSVNDGQACYVEPGQIRRLAGRTTKLVFPAGSGTFDVEAFEAAGAKSSWGDKVGMALDPNEQVLKKLQYSVGVNDLTAAALTESIELDADIGGKTITGARVEVTEAFDDGAGPVSTVAVELGIDGIDVDLFMGSTEVFGLSVGTKAGVSPGASLPATMVSGADLDILFTSDVNVDTLTTGQLTITVWYID